MQIDKDFMEKCWGFDLDKNQENDSSTRSLAQQRLSEVGQLFVCYVFDLDVSVKYLEVTFSYTQKSVKFRSGFIF